MASLGLPCLATAPMSQPPEHLPSASLISCPLHVSHLVSHPVSPLTGSLGNPGGCELISVESGFLGWEGEPAEGWEVRKKLMEIWVSGSRWDKGQSPN